MMSALGQPFLLARTAIRRVQEGLAAPSFMMQRVKLSNQNPRQTFFG
jgi:hypothetical protein